MTPEEKALIEAALAIDSPAYSGEGRCCQSKCVWCDFNEARAAYRKSLEPKPPYFVEEYRDSDLWWVVKERQNPTIRLARCGSVDMARRICRLLNESEGKC